MNLSTPYLARGFAVPTMVPLVDREVYPEDLLPVGQRDYMLFYGEHFARAAADFEADVAATFAVLLRGAPPIDLSAPAVSGSISRHGGWFGARRAPAMPRDETLMSDEDFATIVPSYGRTGFKNALAMYLNDADNLAYAAEAPNYGRVTVPSLFIHAGQDPICNTVRGRMAEPMREDVDDLTEVVIDAGHLIILEGPAVTNEAIDQMAQDPGQAPPLGVQLVFAATAGSRDEV